MSRNPSSRRPRRLAKEKAATGYDSQRHPREPLAELVDLEALRGVVEPVVQQFGLVLEELTARGAGSSQTLQIVVDLTEDRTDAVELDTLAEVSQAVSQTLDERSEAPESAYLLEVTSPGAARRLTQPRHWKRSVGRLIALTTEDGEKMLARLIAVEGEAVRIARRKETKKGQPESYRDPELLDLDRIAQARVEVEFRAPEGSGGPEADAEPVD